MALAHGLGHLEGSSGAVPGGEHALHIGGHAPVHFDIARFRFQGGQQVGGGNSLPENNSPVRMSNKPNL